MTSPSPTASPVPDALLPQALKAMDQASAVMGQKPLQRLLGDLATEQGQFLPVGVLLQQAEALQAPMPWGWDRPASLEDLNERRDRVKAGVAQQKTYADWASNARIGTMLGMMVGIPLVTWAVTSAAWWQQFGLPSTAMSALGGMLAYFGVSAYIDHRWPHLDWPGHANPDHYALKAWKLSLACLDEVADCPEALALLKQAYQSSLGVLAGDMFAARALTHAQREREGISWQEARERLNIRQQQRDQAQQAEIIRTLAGRP